MQRQLRRRLVLCALIVGLGTAAVLWPRPVPVAAAENAGPDEAAVRRTRETVRMLDDLYKSAVVHVTATYVKAQEKTPAAKVAKQMFRDMQEKGWHSGRLVDATGEPVNPANAPKTEFEKAAIAQLKAGKPYYDEVGQKDGKPVLRAATVVPVVMKQCIACHAGKKEGDLLGALVYELPIK
jgi:hypothetical protein